MKWSWRRKHNWRRAKPPTTSFTGTQGLTTPTSDPSLIITKFKIRQWCSSRKDNSGQTFRAIWKLFMWPQKEVGWKLASQIGQRIEQPSLLSFFSGIFFSPTLTTFWTPESSLTTNGITQLEKQGQLQGWLQQLYLKQPWLKHLKLLKPMKHSLELQKTPLEWSQKELDNKEDHWQNNSQEYKQGCQPPFLIIDAKRQLWMGTSYHKLKP